MTTTAPQSPATSPLAAPPLKNGTGGRRWLEVARVLVPALALVGAVGTFALTRASTANVERVEERSYPRRDGDRLERLLDQVVKEQQQQRAELERIRADVVVIRAILERDRSPGSTGGSK